MEELEREVKKKAEAYRDVIRTLVKKTASASEEDFELLINYLSGNIAYVGIKRYDWDMPSLFEYSDALFERTSSSRSYGIKVAYVFGSTDKKIHYGLSEYSDGSGSTTKSRLLQTRTRQQDG